MTLSEKVAYLKGVAEGLKFDPEKSPEGKLISIMMDILEHMALNAEETDDSIQALADQLDEVSDSMELLETCVYGDEDYDLDEDDDEDDEDYDLDDDDEDDYDEDEGCLIGVECPQCGDTLMLTPEVVSSGVVTCPGCGRKFSVEVEYEDDTEDEDDEDN